MKIHWKRVVIAGIWAEALLLASYLPLLNHAESVFGIIVVTLAWFGSMFLGGLWVARRVDSCFILHGALVGIVAAVAYAAWRQIVLPGPIQWIPELHAIAFKMLVCAAGAFVGGIRRKNMLSAQAAK